MYVNFVAKTTDIYKKFASHFAMESVGHRRGAPGEDAPAVREMKVVTRVTRRSPLEASLNVGHQKIFYRTIKRHRTAFWSGHFHPEWEFLGKLSTLPSNSVLYCELSNDPGKRLKMAADRPDRAQAEETKLFVPDDIITAQKVFVLTSSTRCDALCRPCFLFSKRDQKCVLQKELKQFNM